MTHSSAWPPAARTDVYVCELEHRAVAVAVARRTARTVLTGWAVPEEAVHDAVLVVSELVTNAVEHALPPVALRLRRGESDGVAIIRVEVTDGGPAPRQGAWASSCGPGEHGRGAGIVDSLGIGSGVGSRTRGGGRWADLIAA
ncbi:ATP-binding protein [Streptomyces sp. NPDC026673]|uniref:ATP-binding protein n=1 Tax=Streptomyces sp. NPDC026673 TaxID=3155724 RepID=UPI0033E61A7A